MAKDYAALTRDISTYIGELRRLQPGPMQAFSELAKSATAEGALELSLFSIHTQKGFFGVCVWRFLGRPFRRIEIELMGFVI